MLLLLLLQGAVAVDVTLPGDVRDMTGLDPRTPEWVEAYGAFLRRVLARLAP